LHIIGIIQEGLDEDLSQAKGGRYEKEKISLKDILEADFTENRWNVCKSREIAK
jgi:hypothetical protein